MTILIIAVLIGLLPAAIAQSKGHSFVGWWVFGAALFIVALPMALMLKPKGEAAARAAAALSPPVVQVEAAQPSAAEELGRFAKLRDEGVITAEEFEAKKRQLLGLGDAPAQAANG